MKTPSYYPVFLRNFALATCFAATLAGCETFAVAEGVSTVASGKTFSDHVVSFTSGKDCSTVRTEQGLTYCVEDMPKVNQERIYCYRSLGDVVCYNSPDTRRTQETRLGLTEHNQAQ
ncbi:MAG: hypothetical protein RIC16_10570 [Rhodospirillales bacterium]